MNGRAGQGMPENEFADRVQARGSLGHISGPAHLAAGMAVLVTVHLRGRQQPFVTAQILIREGP